MSRARGGWRRLSELLDDALAHAWEWGARGADSANPRRQPQRPPRARPTEGSTEETHTTGFAGWEELRVHVAFVDDGRETLALKVGSQTGLVTVVGHDIDGETQEVLAVWITPNGEILFRCPPAGRHDVALVERRLDA